MEPVLKRVLLVDDDRDILTVATMALEMVGGLQVRACASGAEALAAIAEFAPQLVLLDVMMPDMSGPEVLQKLRQRPETADLPVAFLTASKAQRNDLDRLRALGVIDVLAKPFDAMLIADQVKALWERCAAGRA